MIYEELKARQRGDRDGYHPILSLRVQRALSWPKRAEEAEDLDGVSTKHPRPIRQAICFSEFLGFSQRQSHLR